MSERLAKHSQSRRSVRRIARPKIVGHDLVDIPRTFGWKGRSGQSGFARDQDCGLAVSVGDGRADLRSLQLHSAGLGRFWQNIVVWTRFPGFRD